MVLAVYPNPMASRATLSVVVPNDGYTEVDLISMDGQRDAPVARLYHAGNYTIPFTTDLPSGAYLLSLRSGNDRITKVVEIIR